MIPWKNGTNRRFLRRGIDSVMVMSIRVGTGKFNTIIVDIPAQLVARLSIIVS